MLNAREQYSDIRRILAESAKKHGATLRFNTTVASVHPDPDRPSVTLVNGERLEGDVVLGADGCVLPGFLTRTAVMEAIEQEDDTMPSGTQVFRWVSPFIYSRACRFKSVVCLGSILIPEEDMEQLEHLKSVRDSVSALLYMLPPGLS